MRYQVMRIKTKLLSGVKWFLRESGAGGWFALLIALILVTLMSRGLINTPEHTVTPLSDFLIKTGVVQTTRCGETPTYKTILYLRIDGDEDRVYEVRTRRYECEELLSLVEKGAKVTFWVHPSMSDWVGQLMVEQETVLPRSDVYEDAWRGHWNFLYVGSIISAALLYYAFKGQFKRSRRGRRGKLFI